MTKLNPSIDELIILRDKLANMRSFSKTFEDKQIELKNHLKNKIENIFIPTINQFVKEPYFLETTFNELKVFINSKDNKDKDLFLKIVFKKPPHNSLSSQSEVISLIFIIYLSTCTDEIDFKRLNILGNISKSLLKNQTKLIKKLNSQFKIVYKKLNYQINSYKAHVIKHDKQFSNLLLSIVKLFVSKLNNFPYKFESTFFLHLPNFKFKSLKVDVIEVVSIKKGMVKYKLTNLQDPKNPQDYIVTCPKDDYHIPFSIMKTVNIPKMIEFIET